MALCKRGRLDEVGGGPAEHGLKLSSEYLTDSHEDIRACERSGPPSVGCLDGCLVRYAKDSLRVLEDPGRIVPDICQREHAASSLPALMHGHGAISLPVTGRVQPRHGC